MNDCVVYGVVTWVSASTYADLSCPYAESVKGMSLVVSVLALTLSFFATLVMAVPVIKPDRIEFPAEKLGRAAVIAGLGVPSAGVSKEASDEFNAKAWRAAQRQRKYTTRGLLLVALSIALQLLAFVT